MPDRLPSTHSNLTRRRFLLAIGIAEHDLHDVLADPWCQKATDELLDIVQKAADALSEEGRMLRLTNYRSRYGYPRRWALLAGFWWRLEHCCIGSMERFAYPRRKTAERKGSSCI